MPFDNLIHQIRRVQEVFRPEMLAGPFAAFGQFNAHEITEAFKAAVPNGAEEFAVTVADGYRCPSRNSPFDL